MFVSSSDYNYVWLCTASSDAIAVESADGDIARTIDVTGMPIGNTMNGVYARVMVVRGRLSLLMVEWYRVDARCVRRVSVWHCDCVDSHEQVYRSTRNRGLCILCWKMCRADYHTTKMFRATVVRSIGTVGLRRVDKAISKIHDFSARNLFELADLLAFDQYFLKDLYGVRQLLVSVCRQRH